MRRTVGLALLASGNLVLAFLFHTLVLVTLGASAESDAFFASMTVPAVILSIGSVTMANVLVPFMSGAGERRDAVATALTSGQIAIFAFVALLLALSAPWWVRVVFPGFAPATARLTATLSRMQLLAMVFYGLYAVLRAAQHARGRLAWAETTPIVGTAVAVALVVPVLRSYGAAGAAWLLVARAAIQAGLLAIRARWARPSLSRELGRNLWERLRPLLAMNVFSKAVPLVDHYLASLAAPGGVALLNVTQQAWGAGLQVANGAIVAPLLASLSADHAAGNKEAMRRDLRRALLLGLALTGAAVLVLVLVGRPLLTAVLATRGRMTAADVALLWTLLVAMSGYAIAGIAGQSYAAAFYATGNTAVPAKIGTAGLVLSVIAKIAGFFTLGLVGIALASSVHQLFNTTALWLRRRSIS